MITLRQAKDDYLLSSRADGNAPKTVTWYDDILRVMTERIGHDVTLDKVTSATMRQYIADMRDRDLSDATIASYITALHAFWSWCHREYNILNPMRNIKKPRIKKMKPKAISKSDFMTLYNATSGTQPMQWRDRTIMCMFVDTGMRLGGLVRLQVDDVDILSRRAIVTEKGNKQRTIFWGKYTNHLLAMWIHIRPPSIENSLFVSMREGRLATGLTLSGVQQIMKRYKRQLGIKGAVNPHSFRHRFAIEYLKNGGDPLTLARLGGWEDIQTIKDSYLMLDDDELSQLHESNSPLSSIMSKE